MLFGYPSRKQTIGIEGGHMQPSWVEALGFLLATQSFLLAATAIVGSRDGFATAVFVPPLLSKTLVIATALFVAGGTLAAWGQLYDLSFSLDASGIVGFSLGAASLGQVVLTVLLAIGAG